LAGVNCIELQQVEQINEVDKVWGYVQKFADWIDNETTTTTTPNTRWESIQKVMAAKRTRLTHKIVIQLHLVLETCTICSSLSRWPVR